MNDQKKLEEEFKNYLDNKPSNIDAYIKENFSDNLSIYNNNITQNLKSVLKHTYQNTQKLIGDECFAQIATEYVFNNPATSGNLDDYGAGFCDFIYQKLSSKLPYVKDIAKIEWMLQLSMNENDNFTDNSTLLSSLTPDELAELRPKLHPSVNMLKSNYPIYQIWQLLIGKSSQNINYNDGGEYICITKQSYLPSIDKISMKEYNFLEALTRNKSLLEIFEILEDDFQIILAKFINQILYNYVQ